MADDKRADALRLLLMEDDPDSGEAQKAALEGRGIQVTHCTSAEEGLTLFKPENFDVIVSDIRLEGMSGVELLRVVRTLSPDFPVILLTGYESIDTAIEAVRLGAQDYILKPLDTIDDLAIPAAKAAEAYRILLCNRTLEAELRKREAQLSALAVELQSVREEERKKLSRSLHDELGQSLTGMKLGLSWVSSCLPEENTELRERLDALCELSDEMIRTTQRVSAELRPPVLDDLGLGPAIEWLTAKFNDDTGIECGAVIDTGDVCGSEDVCTALFRILQEALTNVIRHSGASKVDIRLTNADGGLILTIKDNGRGIDTEDISSGTSIGLIGMRERAAALNGDISIDGTQGRGSIITVKVPVND